MIESPWEDRERRCVLKQGARRRDRDFVLSALVFDSSEEGRIMDVLNRRAELRFRMEGTAEIQATTKRRDLFRGQLLDISKSGLRIRVSRALAVSSRPRITVGNLHICAEVRHCSEVRSDLFDIGLKIVGVRPAAEEQTSHNWPFPLALRTVLRNSRRQMLQLCGVKEE